MDGPDSAPYFIAKEAANAVFDWKEAIHALQDAYGQEIDERAVPPRVIATGQDAWMRVLPAIPPGSRYFGAKLMGLAGNWDYHGLEYVIVLFDRQTHRIAAFLDANVITGLRTAATSAAALDRLAPARPVRLAVLGSGFEATTHTRAFAAVRELSEVTVYSPTPANREAFAERFSAELGVPVRAVASPQGAVEGADVVLSAAVAKPGTSHTLHGDWVDPGACIVSIGSVAPAARELDVSVIDRCDLMVCDVVEEVLHQTGDLIAAKAAGIDATAKSFSLNALMKGDLASRVAASRQPMFKSVGSGFQDVVTAGLILTKAVEAGLATPLPISFETKGPAGKTRA